MRWVWLACLAASCVAPPPVTQAPRVAYGTVVSVRPIPATAEQRAAILARLGTAPATPLGAEILVRQDNGAMVSVVQADALGLRLGERVALRLDPMPLVGRTLPGG